MWTVFRATVSVHICLDCFYHAGISFILTLLILSPSLDPGTSLYLHPLLLTAQLGHLPIGRHHPFLSSTSGAHREGSIFRLPLRRLLRLNPQLRELEALLTDFHQLNISTDSEFFIPVTLERAWHNHLQSPVSDSPELHPPIVGSLDSPFTPGGFAHSTPPHDPLPFLPDSPGLSSLSPLSPLDSPSYLFAPALSASVLVQSNHTSSPSLAFLFDQSAYPVKLNFDPPSLSAPLAPEVSGALSLPLFLPLPVSLPLSVLFSPKWLVYYYHLWLFLLLLLSLGLFLPLI